MYGLSNNLGIKQTFSCYKDSIKTAFVQRKKRTDKNQWYEVQYSRNLCKSPLLCTRDSQSTNPTCGFDFLRSMAIISSEVCEGVFLVTSTSAILLFPKDVTES